MTLSPNEVLVGIAGSCVYPLLFGEISMDTPFVHKDDLFMKTGRVSAAILGYVQQWTPNPVVRPVNLRQNNTASFTPEMEVMIPVEHRAGSPSSVASRLNHDLVEKLLENYHDTSFTKQALATRAGQLLQEAAHRFQNMRSQCDTLFREVEVRQAEIERLGDIIDTTEALRARVRELEAHIHALNTQANQDSLLT